MINKKKTVTAIISALGIISSAALVSKNRNKRNSLNWIKSLSDMDWEKEREIVRKKYCKAKDYSEAVKLEKMLHLFDKVYILKHYDANSVGCPVHREHGWHLP